MSSHHKETDRDADDRSMVTSSALHIKQRFKFAYEYTRCITIMISQRSGSETGSRNKTFKVHLKRAWALDIPSYNSVIEVVSYSISSKSKNVELQENIPPFYKKEKRNTYYLTIKKINDCCYCIVKLIFGSLCVCILLLTDALSPSTFWLLLRFR